MKRAAVLIALSMFVLASPAPVRAQTSNDNGEMSLSFFLRASLRDEIVACSDHDFRDSSEALSFSDALGPELGFGPGDAVYDSDTYKDCVRMFPDRDLTTPGPRSHERIFDWNDAATQEVAAKELHLRLSTVTVCAPELPSSISPTSYESANGDCDHPFQYEHTWFSDESGHVPEIKLSFRATAASLLVGLLGEAAFWGVITFLLIVFVRRMRRKEWRFFVKHRFIAWPVDVIVAAVLLFLAGELAPYETGWIPSLQLYLRLPPLVETILVGMPAVALVVLMLVGPARQVRRIRRAAHPVWVPSPPPPGPPTLALPDWWGREGSGDKPEGPSS